ncbi:hypothetical protein [Acinetobacter colistiniresistens]|uniref:hypothetical protein n=1 Tax=Acinetobacter colistiniresistens TaxID=280145 RepID=UPI002FDFD606
MKPQKLLWCSGSHLPSDAYLDTSTNQVKTQKIKGLIRYNNEPYPHAQVAFFNDYWALIAVKAVNDYGEFELRSLPNTLKVHIVCKPLDPTKNCQVFRDIYSE